MKKAKIKNIASGIEKNCDILRKNDNILEVVLEGTTIKILLKKKTTIFSIPVIWKNKLTFLKDIFLLSRIFCALFCEIILLFF